jgi:hypothetical protein
VRRLDRQLDNPKISHSVFLYSNDTLILKHANKNRLGSIEWGPNDFDVLDDNRRCIGRIFLSVQAPQGRPWFWTITAPEYPPTINSRGYSSTREQAMKDFKTQWLS